MSNIQSHRSDSEKSPTELEHDVDELRQRLSRTVDALGDRLSPGELIDQALDMVREHGGEFGRNLGAQAKSHTVPMLLTGVGLTWLMTASSRPAYREDRGFATRPGDRDANLGEGATPNFGSPVQGAEQSDKDSISQRARDELAAAKDGLIAAKESVADRYHSAADSVGENLHSAREAMSARTSRLREGAHQQAARMQHGFEDMLYEQPLMMGALGVALGAALGAMLPETETENRLMGHARDTVVERGKQMAAQEYEKGRETVKETARQIESGVQEASSGSTDAHAIDSATASARPETSRV
jgi:hypothetical protein